MSNVMFFMIGFCSTTVTRGFRGHRRPLLNPWHSNEYKGIDRQMEEERNVEKTFRDVEKII